MSLDPETPEISAHPHHQGQKNAKITWGQGQGSLWGQDPDPQGQENGTPENVSVTPSEDHGQGIESRPPEVAIVQVLKILRQEADVTESLDQGRGSLCRQEGQGLENLYWDGQDLESL